PRPPHPSTPFPTRRSSDLTNGADYAGRPGGALRTSLSLSASRTRRALLSQRGPISAFNRGDVRVRTLGRPGRTVEKNRVIGQIIRRIVPCTEPIQPFLSRRTSHTSWTLWPLGTGCTLRPLRTNGADYAGRPGGALRTSQSLSLHGALPVLLSQRGPISAFNRGDVRVRTLGRPGRTVEKNRVI